MTVFKTPDGHLGPEAELTRRVELARKARQRRANRKTGKLKDGPKARRRKP